MMIISSFDYSDGVSKASFSSVCCIICSAMRVFFLKFNCNIDPVNTYLPFFLINDTFHSFHHTNDSLISITVIIRKGFIRA